MRMDETVTTTSPDEQDATATPILSLSTPPISPQQAVCDAAAFGWAITELLGRCYLLSEAVPALLDWSGAHLVLLQQSYTPREKIRALMAYIRNLADDLDLSSCTIDDANDADNGKSYVDVLEELVKQFCQYKSDTALDPAFAQLRGNIN